jgi:FkbM family methyltransferase
VGPAQFFAEVDALAQPYELVIAAMAASGAHFAVADIGAHYGVTTMDTTRLLRRFGVKKRTPMLAFDGGRAARLTQRNLDNNGFEDVRFFDAAIGPIDGHAIMHQHTEHTEDNSLLSRPGPGVPVRVMKLDTVLRAENCFGPLCVKIDVQGAEPSVLMGMREVMAAHPVAILMEYTPWAIRNSGIDPTEFLLDLLRTHAAFDVGIGRGTRLMEITPVTADAARHMTDMDDRPWTDLVLVPRTGMPLGAEALARLRAVATGQHEFTERPRAASVSVDHQAIVPLVGRARNLLSRRVLGGLRLSAWIVRGLRDWFRRRLMRLSKT